jgi:DNA-binding protein HU-beta
MNKTELARAVSGQVELSLNKATKAIDVVFQEITKSLQKGDKAAFVGFGTFSVSKRAARNGRNPRTGDSIKIAARNAPRFAAGKALKNAVNNVKSTSRKSGK